MGDTTKIEWADRTWNPLRVRVRANAAEIARAKGYTSLVQIGERMAGHVGQHCEHVSDECDECYAETRQHRCLPGDGTGLPYDRRSRDLVEAFVDEKMLRKALSWREPGRVFVENHSDIFGDWFTDEMIDRVLATMALTPHQTYQVLTKRPERMYEYFQGEESPYFYACTRIEKAARQIASDLGMNQGPEYGDWPLPNVWLGVSVGRRKALSRIDTLRKTPAAVRFLSIEPLLEDLGPLDLARIDWAIIGGESGARARPCDLGWVKSIVAQCATAGVACFVKQFGAKPRDGAFAYACELDPRKGGNPADWPRWARLRQFPAPRVEAA